jgi:GMP synthase (glutamine-hydrolysing)
VLVDHGLMRLNECDQVKKDLGEHLGVQLTVADARERFMEGLAGVVDPEKKRKFIGPTLYVLFRYPDPSCKMLADISYFSIDVFEQEAIKLEKAAEQTPNAGKIEFFLQGKGQTMLDESRLSRLTGLIN